MSKLRTVRNSLTATGIAAALTLSAAGIAAAEPPGIPDGDTAKSQLTELTVAPDGSQDGYDRDKFKHWIDQGDNCNTREAVLKRDGDDVEVGNDCAPTSGSWFSPYDDETWTETGDVDIDHVVPLSAAWRTGAAEWTDAEREAFANDLDGPQLIAVTDNVNQQKGDKSPDAWKPPSVGYWCTYASMWVGVKHKYELTVSEAEKGALDEMLAKC